MVEGKGFFLFSLGFWSCPHLLLANTEKVCSRFWLFCSKHDTIATAVTGTYCGDYSGYDVLFLDVVLESAGF